MKTKAPPATGPRRFVLVFATEDSAGRRDAIEKLRSKISEMNPQPALTIGTEVMEGCWILTLRPGQFIEDFGTALDPFFCQSAADFEASLLAREHDVPGRGRFPEDLTVR